MSTIRRQGIISSIIVYFGFALGFFNTYLFARGFTEAQYGLYGTFIAISGIIFAMANLGTPPYVSKFFPYYQDNLPPDKNDQFTLSIIISFTGFILVMIGGFLFKDLVVRKYGTNSPDLVTYYYWIFPFGFGFTMFSLLEVFGWQFGKTVFTSFLKEVLFRVFTTVLIVFSFTGIIADFDLFIKLFALTYLLLFLILLVYLVKTKKIHLTFSISKVTRKFYKKFVPLMAFVWGGGLVFAIAQFFDTLVIGAVVENGLAYVGIYTLAQNMSSLVVAPQRALVAAAIGPLSRSWKDKDMGRIQRIYSRSSINQLIFAVGMFVLIWINFTDGVLTFKLRQGYLDARMVFLFIGLMRVVDLGTGLNATIIGTSNYWRVEFYTGFILFAITLPLNYIFTVRFGITGTAVANLVSLTIYNAIRYLFLLKKFGMQPFSIKSLYTLLLGLAAYLVCYLLFNQFQGFGWIVLRSLVFIGIYFTGILALNLSPDVKPVLQNIAKRFRVK